MSQQGPDFLCIGMQKAGTGWLYQAFRAIEGFGMLPIKEFHHFDRLGQFGKNSLARHERSIERQMSARLDEMPQESRKRIRKSVDKYIASRFSTPAYLQLFESDSDLLIGDVTPSYSILEPAAVVDVHKLLPNRPVILSIRHPVDRLWSSFNMFLRRRADTGQFEVIDGLQKTLEREATMENLEMFLGMSRILARSKPSVSHSAWSIYGDDLIVTSLDEIIRQPKKLMERLATRILQRDVVLPDDFEVVNKKASNTKVKINDQQKAMLFDAFAEEIQICKQRYPDIAANWKTS